MLSSLSLFSVVACQVLVVVDVAAGGCGGGACARWCVLGATLNEIKAGGGLGGSVSCFYSFGEPLKTWTYAMLTCIVYHVILLYS